MHTQTIEAHRIIGRLGPSAYLLELPSNRTIRPVFNVEDLFPYRDRFEPPVAHATVSTGRVPKSSVQCLPQFAAGRPGGGRAWR